MNITINFSCLTSRVKANGLVPIYCTLKKGTEVARFSTKLSVQKSSWDAGKSKVKGKTDEARIINEQLDNISKKLKQHLVNLYPQNPDLTIIDLLDEFNHKTVKHPTTYCQTDVSGCAFVYHKCF